jgi:hypothetical protein
MAVEDFVAEMVDLEAAARDLLADAELLCA